ncbi:MAG: nucleotide sugar dehydrogenase [Bdellovibrionia bacterium]
MKTSNPKKIAVLGNWHLAHVTAACMAKLGHEVHLVPSPQSPLPQGVQQKFSKPQLFEPMLDDLWNEQLGKNLFISDLKSLANSEFFFLSLDTPVDELDHVQMDDMAQFVDALKLLPSATAQGRVVIIQSQVPVGTADRLKAELSGQFEITNMPENLRLGKAIGLFLEPEFMYLGGASAAVAKVRSLFTQWTCPVRELSLKESEMVKHSTNFYLATCVSFSSFISDVCESIGVDASNVINVLKLDTRVNPKAPLNPGFGFAGGTLGRDVQILRGVARQSEEFAAFGDAIYEINTHRIQRLIKSVEAQVPRGGRIGLLGLTYKVGTDTLRRSHALAIAKSLIQADLGYSLVGFDPKVKKELHAELSSEYGIKMMDSLEHLDQAVDAAILCTPWPEILQYDWVRFAKNGTENSTTRRKYFFDLTAQCAPVFKADSEALNQYYCPGLFPARMREIEDQASKLS